MGPGLNRRFPWVGLQDHRGFTKEGVAIGQDLYGNITVYHIRRPSDNGRWQDIPTPVWNLNVQGLLELHKAIEDYLELLGEDPHE